jgi:ADP-ribose pyrophosphatase
MCARDLLYDGPHFRVYRQHGWEYAERVGISGIVLIVPLTDDGRLVLNEQFRIPVGKPVIELPAGLVGDRPGVDPESLADGARRELLEETGYQAAQLRFLTAGPPSAGITSEILSFYLATGLRRIGRGGGDHDENIIVHEVPLVGIHDWLLAQEQRGCLIDPKVFIGLHFARLE